MTQKVCIVSLHFSPAHISHLVAYGKTFAALGYDVDFVLHQDYMQFDEFLDCHSAIVAETPEWEAAQKYAHAIIYNAARTNHISAAKLRRQNCKVWYVYHEPWEPLSTYLHTESVLVMAKLVGAHYLSVKMLRSANGVLLPSAYAVESYKRGDIRYNPNFRELPLIFSDEYSDLPCEERRFFSYIGNITKAHGFAEFIEFVRFSIERSLNLRFLIASKRSLPREVADDKLIAKALDRVVIRCGRPLSNYEINQCYARSICVWNLYRRSTQSGVFARAMMSGTPVLASQAGSFREFITDGCEGRLLPDAEPEGVLRAYEDINSNLSRYIVHARKRFVQTFDYNSQLEACGAIFGSASCGEEVECR
jgi:glycosyltransferase involved in cell wall biosynthesis